MELVQKLVTEFRAVRLELEAYRLDVDSIRVALCEVVANKQPSFQYFWTCYCIYLLAKCYELVVDQEFSEFNLAKEH